MELGNAICISDCRSIQDTENDIKIGELICLNHIQKIVPGCENSDVNPNYYDMIRIMISSSVITDGDWVNLPEKFMAGVVMFSKKTCCIDNNCRTSRRRFSCKFWYDFEFGTFQSSSQTGKRTT